MKTTVVPAQVTTVEDKIAGSLGVAQLLLLVAPLFAACLLFALLPPFFGYSTYKVVVTVLIAVGCGLMAIRFKGMLLLNWIIIIARYNLRSRFYLFDKNDMHLRATDQKVEPEEASDIELASLPGSIFMPQLSPADLVRVESIVADPVANLRFTTNRKGELSVRISKVE
jgi:hypothetical protein